MPPLALALVLLAALIHAGWNIVAKRAGGGTHFVMMGALMIMVLWAPLGAVGGLGPGCRAGAWPNGRW